jgi:hypothetical protein
VYYFFAYRAYKKGIWRTLLGIIGLVLTYIVCFFVGMPFVSILESVGINTFIALPLGLLLLFFIVSFIFTNVPVLFFPSLKIASSGEKLAGAFAGGLVGIVIGLFLIWAISTANALITLKHTSQQTHQTTQTETQKKPDILAAVAAALVDKAVNSAISTINDDTNSTDLASAFIEAPSELTTAFQGIAKAQELKLFWQDNDTNIKMANDDIQGLLKEPAFQQLAELPSMQSMLQHVNKSDEDKSTDPQIFLAEKLTYVWKRMRYTRSDPRIVDILNNEEFKKSINQQNPVTLLMNPQAQELAKIIMENNDMQDFDFIADLQDHGPGQPISTQPDINKERKPAKPKKVYKPVVVYRWKDDNGKTQYTTLEHIPEHKRDSAKIFTQ